jgi:hypothetical protein
MLKKRNLNFKSIWYIILIIISLVYFKQLIFIVIISFIIYLLYRYVKGEGAFEKNE